MMEEDRLIALCKSAVEEIDLQLERKRGINVTISELKAFRLKAQEQDPADEMWNDKFYELWVALETTYAVASGFEQEWFEANDIDRIDDALLEMRRMLEDKVTRLERAGSRSDEDGSTP